MTKQSSHHSHRRMDELAVASSSWIASSLTLLAMTAVEVIEEWPMLKVQQSGESDCQISYSDTIIVVDSRGH